MALSTRAVMKEFPIRRACKWRFIHLLLLCSLGLLAAGCVALLDYQPNDRLLDALGVDVAQERLRQTVLRAVSPPIQTVTLTHESLGYKWHPLVGTQKTL
jgi:hypothetical protein